MCFAKCWLCWARDTALHAEQAEFTGRLKFGSEGGRGHFILCVLSSNLSELVLRVMAPGAAQHFCHGDERSLDFTFPGSDRLQNYGPELLFLVILTSPDKSVSAIVNSLSAGSKTCLSLLKSRLWLPPSVLSLLTSGSPAVQ